jgi:putative transposase
LRDVQNAATVGQMPRKPRTEYEGAIHHVTARGNAGGSIVDDENDRRDLIGRLAMVSEQFDWRVHSYCLLDTHVHAVIETPYPTLGLGMRRLLGGYAFQFNRRHNRFGHLFGGRYSASEVDSDQYALEICTYVVLTPVRAGLAQVPEEWEWSSYRSAAGLAYAPPFLETRLVPGIFADDPARAQELYRQHVHHAAARARQGSG